MSFSLHAAQTKAGQVYYFFLFGLTMPLFYLFVSRWFVPALKLPHLYLWLTILGIIGQITAVIVPALPGRKMRIHNIGAYGMALTLLPVTALICYADISVTVKVLAAVGVAWMAGSLGTAFVKPGLIRPNYLPYQAGYVAVFHTVVIVATFAS